VLAGWFRAEHGGRVEIRNARGVLARGGLWTLKAEDNHVHNRENAGAGAVVVLSLGQPRA
jgi:hypothetical protein